MLFGCANRDFQGNISVSESRSRKKEAKTQKNNTIIKPDIDELMAVILPQTQRESSCIIFFFTQSFFYLLLSPAAFFPDGK